MLEDLHDAATRCSADDCERTLPTDPTLVFSSAAGTRRVYECACGAVTITAVADGPAPGNDPLK